MRVYANIGISYPSEQSQGMDQNEQEDTDEAVWLTLIHWYSYVAFCSIFLFY